MGKVIQKSKWIVLCALMVTVLFSGCFINEKVGSSPAPVEVGNATSDDTEESGNATSDDTEESGNATSDDADELENAAPDFTVELNDGSEYTLSSSKGKVVLINIWATWCRPCCAEMPAFQQLYDEYGEELQIVAVNYGESKEDVDKFVQKEGYTFPFAYDEEASVATLYPSQGIPYTVIIDKEGNVFKTFLGASSAEEQYGFYKAAIEEAMSE